MTAPLVEAWDGEVCLVAFEPVEAYGRAQNAPHVVVNRRGGGRALLGRGHERLAVHVLAPGHLQILSAVGRGHAVVGRAPVRHYQTVEAPILLCDFREQVSILRSVLAVDEVVRVHNRADVRLTHRRLERGQINLAHRPLVND